MFDTRADTGTHTFTQLMNKPHNDKYYRCKLDRVKPTIPCRMDNLSFSHYNCTSVIYNFAGGKEGNFIEGKIWLVSSTSMTKCVLDVDRLADYVSKRAFSFFIFFPPFLLCSEHLIYRFKYSKASWSNYRWKASFWSTLTFRAERKCGYIHLE